ASPQRLSLSEVKGSCIALLQLLFLVAISLPGAAQTAPAQRTPVIPGDLEKFIPAQMENWKVPGLAIAVVQNGQVIYSHGFGLRDVKGNLPVTSKTLFAIGSISKSFTSLSMGMLNDEGKLDWDKPVRQYIPEFQMYDPVASERMTPRDLISHRVGMASHDLLWYSSEFSREDLVRRLRFLQSDHDFRSGYHYNNMLVMTAIGPAGSINSKVDDMARYAIFQLGNGKIGEHQLVSEANLNLNHSPQVSMPGGAPSKEIGPRSYAMGWVISSYRGHPLWWHNGGIDGFYALLSLLPDDNLGVVTLTNLLDNDPIPEIVAYHIYDQLLGLDSIDWAKRFQEVEAKQ